jgi:subtilisin-like proprotein convertase family protein
MQNRFTTIKVMKKLLLLLLLTVVARPAVSQVLYNESFTTVVPLPTGWAQQNLSSPVGSSTWFQGNTAVFASNSGAPSAYIAANFQNTTGAGTISNWLFMPSVTLKNGDQLTFFTRKPTPNPDDFPDRLQVRMSTNGTSTNVGATSASVGDFTTVLLDINPTLVVGGYPLTWTQFTVTISGVPTPTTGRLAFRYFVTDGGPSGNNSDYIGIDDVVYTAFTGPCTGAPAPGNTNATPASVCPSLSFTLSLASTPTTSGNTYQWQSASSGTGPWTNITGATNSTLTTSQTSATWYRCNVTCNAGPTTTASNPVEVLMNPPTSCYCTPPATNCSFSDVITNVNLGGINNNSTCAVGPPTGYSNFTTSVAPGTIFSGAANPMRVTVGPGGTEHVGVWIDYNRSGGFEANEFTALGSGNGVTISNFVNVPATASAGATRMRVRVRFSTPLTGNDACLGYTFGETEDYTVNIVPCVQGSFVTQPTNASIQCSGNASFSVTTAGSLLTYQWQQRINATSPWVNLSNGGVYSGVTTTTLNLTNVPTTMSGYQFRVLISGGCTSPDFSNTGTLTITPLIATTNVSSATICTGSVQQLTLTNASSPTTVTFTNSTPLAIPDGVSAGVSNTVAVAGIPAGAVVSDITVTLNNLTHTWVGDLDINLIAPNGQNINLVGGLNNGGGGNGSDNFVNTSISSNGTVALSGAPAPRTGTFAADRLAGYGPTGNTQTTALWSALTSTMNGTWRLALADFFTPDAGTLNSWTLSITYGAPTTGTWTSTPAAASNTMFTDAAATTAYVAGSLANTIYVKPTANTSYSVVYSTSTPCTSPPTTVNVSVSNPVTISAQPRDTTTCINGNVRFSTTATGNPLAYQWQVSTNGGTSWTNISGETSASLSLNGVTSSMNGNRYRCVVTAAPCGSVNTSGAILTVNPLPTVTVAANVTAIKPGDKATITATGAAGATYTWLLNNEVVAGATGNSISVNVDQLGSYRAVISLNNCSNTSNEIIIGSQQSDKLWIYPNPTSNGNFVVRLYNNTGVVGDVRTVSIYNGDGRLVAEKQFIMVQSLGAYQPMEFSLGNIANGIYTVKVYERRSGTVTGGQLLIGR